MKFRPPTIALAALAAALMAASANGASTTNSAQLPPAPPSFVRLPPAPPPSVRPANPKDRVQATRLSPVEFFRVLLGMTPAERQRALASKPEADRRVILAKVSEYLALPRDVREARLHQTELRWALLTLMKTPPKDRTNELVGIFPTDRPAIEERLRQWDQLPPALQKAYLEKQEFLGFYLRWQGSSLTNRQAMVARLPAERRATWTVQLAQWEALPAPKREAVSAQFSAYFEMKGPDQKAAIAGLSDGEKAQMEKSLQEFAKLPPESKKECVESFHKFAAMTPQERKEFLRNAARWEAMAPGERRLWRQLVRSLPALPPMPPGFEASGSAPPMPPGFVMPPPPPAPASPATPSI